MTGIPCNAIQKSPLKGFSLKGSGPIVNQS